VSDAEPRVALVTGANRGLGLETARQLLTKGLSVVFAGRDAAALERAQRNLAEQDQHRAFTVQMDVTSVESITAAHKVVFEQVGSVNVLVNNAAVLLAGYGRIVNVSSGAGQLAAMSAYAPAYSISKAALNAFTRILADSYRTHGVLVNAVDPGWVRTDMGGSSAPRSPQEGADTIVWLATLPDHGPTGGFFRDRRAIEW
jgi:NAD(P)-dependent dehydrogenase (short-subunit alcohol dehydrogenase family)